MSIKDISQNCVSILATLGIDRPKESAIVIGNACHNIGIRQGFPTNEKDGDRFWVPIAEAGEWEVQYKRNNDNKYRLLGPVSNPKMIAPASNTVSGLRQHKTRYVKAKEKEMEKFLLEACQEGIQAIIKGQSMPIYYLVANIEDKKLVKQYCIPYTVDEAQEEFSNSYDLVPGFWTRHPMDKTSLVSLKNYFVNIVQTQDDERVFLLGKMGAKTVHIQKIDKSNIGGSISGSGGGPILKIHAGASVRNIAAYSNDCHVEFEGNETNPSPDLLKESVWFKNNGEMKKILEGRLDPDNKILSRRVETTLSDDFNFDFNFAIKVLGVGSAKLEGQYESMKNQTRIFEVEF